MKCTICSHPYAADIVRAVKEGRTRKEVAERYGIAASALARHLREHVPAPPPPRPSLPGYRGIAERHEWLYQKTVETYESARSRGDADVEFRALTRLERNLEIQARLHGILEVKDAARGEFASFADQFQRILPLFQEAYDPTIPSWVRLMTSLKALSVAIEEQSK